MLAHTVFANFIQATVPSARTRARPAALKMLARLYWYTVEFGLVRTSRGLTCLRRGDSFLERRDDLRHSRHRAARIAFDLHRVLRTHYLIDAYQKTYFVLDDIEQLFDSVLDADFEILFQQADEPAYEPDARLPPTSPRRRFLDSIGDSPRLTRLAPAPNRRLSSRAGMTRARAAQYNAVRHAQAHRSRSR